MPFDWNNISSRIDLSWKRETQEKKCSIILSRVVLSVRDYDLVRFAPIISICSTNLSNLQPLAFSLSPLSLFSVDFHFEYELKLQVHHKTRSTTSCPLSGTKLTFRKRIAFSATRTFFSPEFLISPSRYQSTTLGWTSIRGRRCRKRRAERNQQRGWRRAEGLLLGLCFLRTNKRDPPLDTVAVNRHFASFQPSPVVPTPLTFGATPF